MNRQEMMENLQGVSPEDNEADDAMPQGQIADDVTLESKLVSRSYLCFVFTKMNAPDTSAQQG